MDKLKFVNKKSVGISKRGIVKERIYKIFGHYKFRIFSISLSGSLDDFFSGGHNG